MTNEKRRILEDEVEEMIFRALKDMKKQIETHGAIIELIQVLLNELRKEVTLLKNPTVFVD